MAEIQGKKIKDRTKNPINLKDIKEVEVVKGIFRKTLAYNKEGLLCHFRLLKGTEIPLHNHIHTQIGYVVKGKLKFFTSNSEFIATTGDSYVFDGNEKHGAKILEDSIIIEVFIPRRDEYII
ncbi:MAG: cupin domain-containing protein [Promethearchaeota archaeon]